MALVAHRIVSRYVPQQREPLTQDEDDVWETELSYGPARRWRSRPSPYFVPASLTYDEYGMPKSDSAAQQPDKPRGREAIEDVSSWYRNLMRKEKARRPPDEPSKPTQRPSPRTSPDSQSTSKCTRPASIQRATVDWFTSDYPRTSNASSSTTESLSTSKPSTFADLFSRNPPPTPSEPAFKPPVFLALGPGNRGFTMLERKGWREGEGLGSGRVVERRRVERWPKKAIGMETDTDIPSDSMIEKEQDHKGSRHHRVATSSAKDATIEVIDLTLSDSESCKDLEDGHLTPSDSVSDSHSELELDPDGRLPETSEPLDASRHHGITLLTPIATTLKADRLGIGLKRRRTKMKAITHTSSALAANIRSGSRLRHDEKARHGKGSRRFARMDKKESGKRRSMLAYMNS